MNRSVIQRRTSTVALILLAGLLALIGRLAYVQLYRGPELKTIAARTQTITFPAEDFYRGDILDRNGIPLTDKGIYPAAVVIPSLVKDPLATSALLAEKLAIPEKHLLNELTSRPFPSWQPKILRPNLTEIQVASIGKLHLPGIYILPLQTRYGPNALAAHLIGHLNSIDTATWEKLKDQGLTFDPRSNPGGYRLSDAIGDKGLERVYEKLLRGGEPEYIWTATVDALGNIVPSLGFNQQANPAGPGQRSSVVLTIDSRIQRMVEEVMDARQVKGAVVVLDVATGEPLAMASRPEFNQNDVRHYTGEGEVVQRADFNNRVLQHFFPGSVFKVLIASAAIEEGLTTPGEEFLCTGKYTYSTGQVVNCLVKEGHGEITLSDAVAKSCNSVFIELGLRLGRDKIIEYARKFGLHTDVLAGYDPATMTSIDIDYGPVATGNASVGQEGVRLSPLQVASLLETVAGGGRVHFPRVVSEVRDSQGGLIKDIKPPSPQRAISPETALQVRMMLAGVTLKGGTATEAWVPEVGTAGKTGSAETGRLDQSGNPVTDAWFAGFAPLGQPKYAVAVYIDDGKYGGRSAAPVFRQIVEGIYGLRKE
ncbi:MAG: peptidoglycan D,D-transpeptidase FtsI family protein [Bacillota bacterium]